MKLFNIHKQSRPHTIRLLVSTYFLFLLAVTTQVKANDVSWIVSQTSADGSYASATDIATPFQSTSEVLNTFNLLAPATDTTAALQYLATESYNSTEHLARKITALDAAGQDSSLLLTELLGSQNPDGGWGELLGYHSTAMDTAFALNTLARLNIPASAQIQSAILYLLNAQQANGGWSGGINPSSVYETSLVVEALTYFKNQYSGVVQAIVSADNYLLSQQNASGLWNTTFESAHALLALTQSITDLSTISSSITAIEQSMLVNHSWDNDVYLTALVLRLLDTHQKRSANPSAGIENGGIVGQVVVAGSDEPVSGATVSVKEQPGVKVTSNSVGAYSFQSLQAGNYTLVVDKPGFVSVSTVATVINGQVTNVGKVALSILPTTGILSGSIYDSVSSKVIGNAQITLNGPQSYVASSDDAGMFVITNILPGTYSIDISANGYNPVSGALGINAGQSLVLKQGLTPEGAFLDDSPADLYGNVVDGSNGQPVAGANVSLGTGQNTTTDATGKFVFASVTRGDHTIMISASDYSDATYSANFAAGSNGNLGNLKIYPANNAQAPTSLTMVGHVISGVSNSSLDGAVVTLVETGEQVTTDQAGNFTLSNITLQNFQLEISATGYQTVLFGVTVNAFGEVSQEFVLPPFVAPDPQVTTSILSGIVTDGTTGLPVSGAELTADGMSPVVANAQGQYTITGISLLEFKLAITAPNYKQAGLNIKLSSHGAYTVDPKLDAIVTEAPDSFQVMNVKPASDTTSANTKARFSADIINLANTDLEGLIIAEIFNAAGESEGTILPYIPGTMTEQGSFLFAASEVKTLEFDWGVKQATAGMYQIVVRAVEPGTINRSNPTGTVLAEAGSYITVLPTQLIAGATHFDPPLTQAGTSTPVNLSALIVNQGNVNLSNTGFTLTITDPDTSNVIHTAQANADQLKILNNKIISFGDWLPTKFGNLPVSILPNDSNISGSISGTLYVGDKATGTFTVDRQIVPEGEQTVRGTISLHGVDTKTGASTDPLFFAVRNAVTKGGSYVGNNAISWHKSNRCLGCHIQTQSHMGLASSLEKADISAEQTQYLHNTLMSSQQSNGGVYLSHPGYSKTQTSFALWSLRAWEDKAQTYRTMYHASRFMLDRKSGNSTETYWNRDHTSGYVNSTSNISALVTMGMADVIKSSKELDLSKVRGYTLDTGVSLSSISRPLDMEFGPDGMLYAVKYNGAIDKIDTATKQVTQVATIPSTAYGLAIANDGVMYVTANRSLIRINLDGSQDVLYSSGATLTDVELGSDGLLYVSDYTNHRILRFTTDGAMEVLASGGLILNPYGLAFDRHNDLIIANNRLNILKMTPDKTVSAFSDGLAYRVLWLDVAPDNQVYASTHNQHGMYRLTPEGHAERIFQHSNQLRGIAIKEDSGQVFISNDSTNNYHELIISGVTQDLLPSYEAELPKMVRYFLNRYSDNTSDNTIHALRMSALAEARNAITDPSLLQEIDTAIVFEENVLRNRQRSDGGWGRYTSWGSDPLVTAMVGLALDYTNPSADDPMVQRTIQYLLNTQRSDGSWNNNNSFFSTRLASTSFVMAYMPKALDRLGGIDVDLTVDIPSNITLSNATVAESSVTPSVTGNQHFWSLTGVTSNERVIEFDMTLHNMTLNEERAVANQAYMEFNNSFNDDLIHVDIEVPTVMATSELGLAVITDKPTYQANEDVIISPTVSNTAPVIDSGSVELSIRASGSTDNLYVLAPIATGDINTGASVTLTSTWNTDGQYVGAYEVYARLIDAQGRVAAEAVAPFSILDSGIAVASSVTTDKPVYMAWDTVNITGRVRNISANVIQPNTHIELTVKDPAGSTLYFNTVKEGELLPGSLRDLPFSLTLTDADSGEYPVELVVKDDFTRSVLTTSATQFQVQKTELQSLVGTVVTSPNWVYQGDPTVCEDTVINRSATDLTGVGITRQLFNVSTGQVLNTWPAVIDLVNGATKSNLQSINTDNMEIGSYLCVVSATINGNTSQLAAAGFEVLEPPIKFSVDFKQGDRGRLLVLLDEEKACNQEEHDNKDNDSDICESSHDNEDKHDDPHGPGYAPSLADQRAFLESQLDSQGWSYTIVTNADDFTYEMRSGGYSVYAIFSEHEKLDNNVQKELREAVYRGEGLLVAGSHDERNHQLAEPLGIKVEGKHANATGIAYSNSPLNLTGEQVFAYQGKPKRIELGGAAAIAIYTGLSEHETEHEENESSKHSKNEANDDEHDAKHENHDVAATYQQYGLGNAVYVGFDLVAQATATGDTGLFDELLNASLGYVHPSILLPVAGRVVPVTLTLTNEGIATSGQVVLTLPEGVEVVDAGNTTHDSAQTLAWTFNLVEEQSDTLSFWVRLPGSGNTLDIPALIQTGIAPELNNYDTVSLSITPVILPGLDDALTQLAAVTSSNKNYDKAAKYLNNAQDELSKEDYENTLEYLLKATDYLLMIDEDEARSIRKSVDHEIAIISRKLKHEAHGEHHLENEKEHDNKDDVN